MSALVGLLHEATPLANAFSNALAWTPFLEPWPGANRSWWMLILPLAFFLAMAWKAVRVPRMETYWREVISMTVQIVLGVIGIAIVLYILVVQIMPRIPAE
jgi:hypothetical protein